jgi:hypothetical protein
VDIDDLYGAPLDRFVPERTELAKALRKEGRRDEAAEVAALRKPSVAAWAVNQLIRTQARSIKDLFDAGDELRGAHERAASGRGDAQELRKATQDERAAVDMLVDAARGLLTSDGHELSPTVIDRVADTLRAAALDPDARSQVNQGRLERELRHVGLGFSGDIAAAPATAPKRKAPAAKRKQDQEQEAEAEARERERAQALKDARAAEKDARREVERAQRSVDSAQARRDKAAAALDDAERELADARAQAEAATAAHDQAAGALARIQTE